MHFFLLFFYFFFYTRIQLWRIFIMLTVSVGWPFLFEMEVLSPYYLSSGHPRDMVLLKSREQEQKNVYLHTSRKLI